MTVDLRGAAVLAEAEIVTCGSFLPNSLVKLTASTLKTRPVIERKKWANQYQFGYLI